MDKAYERLDEKTLRFERLFPGPIERVWAFLTEGDKRAIWLCGGEWDLRPGGRTELIFNNDDLSAPGDGPPERYAEDRGEIRLRGEIVSVEPPTKLVMLWVEEDGSKSRVTFELAPAGEQVRLVLTHTGISSLDLLRGIAAGWHAHLHLWQSVAEGRERPSFWAVFNALYERYTTELV